MEITVLAFLGALISSLLMPFKINNKEESYIFFQLAKKKIISKKYYANFILNTIIFTATFLLIINKLNIGTNNLNGVIATFFVLLILVGCFYLARYDFLFYSVPALPLYIGIFIGVFINLLVIILSDNSKLVTDTFSIIPIYNILTAIAYGSVFFIIYRISSEKAMGEADMYIAAFTGLTLGPLYSLIAFYLMIISTLIYAFPEIVRKKTIKNIELPLIPFMIVGYILSILITPIIIQSALLDLLIYQPF